MALSICALSANASIACRDILFVLLSLLLLWMVGVWLVLVFKSRWVAGTVAFLPTWCSHLYLPQVQDVLRRHI
jgi:ABC-type bacteriocin/lantibiotic exporter with double-glycine peptidase domain